MMAQAPLSPHSSRRDHEIQAWLDPRLSRNRRPAPLMRPHTPASARSGGFRESTVSGALRLQLLRNCPDESTAAAVSTRATVPGEWHLRGFAKPLSRASALASVRTARFRESRALVLASVRTARFRESRALALASVRTPRFRESRALALASVRTARFRESGAFAFASVHTPRFRESRAWAWGRHCFWSVVE